MTVNLAALDAALAAIDADPKSWDQGTWAGRTACGTVFCLAGHVAAQAGAQFLWDEPFKDEAVSVARPDGGRITIDHLAIEILDIDYDQADCLFNAENTRGDLQAMRDALAVDPSANLENVCDRTPVEDES